MRKRIVVYTLLLVGSLFLANAQETGEDDFGFWAMYFGTNRVSDAISIHTEAQIRYYE
ncbi:MAG: DUF2490 domain-containing protein, partial [Flavobacterium sp.]